MEYYTVLTVATIVIALFAAVLFKVRRDWGVLVGTAALYYWSLYGAWSIVLDKSGGYSGKSYHYLESKMFPVALDDNYLMTLLLYAAFIVTVQLTLMATLRTPGSRPIPRLTLRHEPILLIGFAAALGSFLIMRDKLGIAYAMNTSAYRLTRSDPGQWFTLHQVLNRVALVPPAIGAAALAAGKTSRYFVNQAPAYVWPAYAALLGGMCAFAFTLGNKNEVFTALIAGFLAYVASTERPRWFRAACTVGIGTWFLYTIDLFRGVPLSGLWNAVTQQIGEADGVGKFVSSSNEAFAAHFSMYGALASGTPVNFGYSLYAFVCSLVPRVFWPDRPRDIYLYYSESVGTIQNQGYSLHQATGWYLNFGYAGVILGGIVMGLIWAKCLNAHGRLGVRRGLLLHLLAIVAPWTFAANLPAVIRAGPEGYKGFIVDGALIPVGTLAFACRERRRKGTQPLAQTPPIPISPPGTPPTLPAFSPAGGGLVSNISRTGVLPRRPLLKGASG